NRAGVVQRIGAVASGTNGMLFTLPAGMAPVSDTYVQINLCGGLTGRLLIQPSGAVNVQPAPTSTFADAQCFTSLDGVSFDPSPTLTPLSLMNGWIGAPFATSPPSVTMFGGIVYFRGAIANGTSTAL